MDMVPKLPLNVEENGVTALFSSANRVQQKFRRELVNSCVQMIQAIKIHEEFFLALKVSQLPKLFLLQFGQLIKLILE